MTLLIDERAGFAFCTSYGGAGRIFINMLKDLRPIGRMNDLQLTPVYEHLKQVNFYEQGSSEEFSNLCRLRLLDLGRYNKLSEVEERLLVERCFDLKVTQTFSAMQKFETLGCLLP